MSHTARVRLVEARGSLAVLDKPAALPTEPERSFDGSLLEEAAALLGVRWERLHAHTRLDVGVSGAVLVSSEDPVRGRIANDPTAVRRRYVGITAGEPNPPSGTWSAPIGRARGSSWTVGGRHARPARTDYETVALGSSTTRAADTSLDTPALVAFGLVTGRTHQIRVHAASAGVPVLGDRRYGGPRRFAAPDGGVWEMHRIALHALVLEIRLFDPPWRIVVPPPEELSNFWQRLGGDERDFERAAK